MKHLFFLLIAPYFILCQEFYPGFLSELDAPICYNTSTVLTFETLPSGGDETSYTYQWQKSWNESNWFDIQNATSINYTTDFLNTDTYYRVTVSYQGINILTNTIAVYVLPPLVSGALMDVDSLCNNGVSPVFFETQPSGAEFNWGGFSEFSYQWQQGNISENEMLDLTLVDWINVGDDSNTHTPIVDPGLYCFRCIITSPHGCGTVLTDPVIVQINDCFISSLSDIHTKKQIVQTFNILGQNNNKKSLIVNIYDNGFVEKKYILE